MFKVIGTVLVAFGLSAAAQAAVVSPLVFRVPAAPEIDPGSAMAALTLLGGALAVIGGRRLKKK